MLFLTSKIPLAITVLCSLLGCASPPPAPAAGDEPTPGRRFIDLLRLAEATLTPEDGKFRVVVRAFAGDYRPAFFLHPPREVVLGPLPPAEDCVLRFGLGLTEKAWEKSDGVVFSVALRRGDQEQSLFRHLLDPRQGQRLVWRDHEVPIPDTATGPFSLVLATGNHETKNHDLPLWGAPHVVCRAGTVAPKPADRPHVVLISIDTLRWDHLGLYGYRRETSPHLDAFARDAVVFERAFSTAPYTLPSHASMLTGLYPHEHGAGHSFPEAPLEPPVVTLAETLRQHGYRTIGFTAGGSMTSKLGMDQGFDEWTERQRGSLRAVLPAVFDALGRAEQPIFLFLHTYDVHAPYIQPEEARYFSAAERAPAAADGEWDRVRAMYYHRHHKMERFRDVEDVIAAYDSGIRYVDAQLATLFDYLREIGIFDHAVIVVTADHGESLYEHRRYFGHAHTLGDQEIRIPLIVRVPGARITGRRDELVQLVDVAPLILARVGIEPPAPLSGHDPLDDGAPDPELAIGEASITGARFVRSRDWKVVSPSAPRWQRRAAKLFGDLGDRFPAGWQVYHLAEDPGETDNLFGEVERFPPEVRRLIQRLRAMDPPGEDTETAPPPEGELAENLRALGYLQ